MSKQVRVRFAPSPTGRLHIGTARTALFNWLFVRREQGVFVLRIEDTDRDRSTEEFEAAILEDLAWLGLNWDEGPDIGGPYGPYRQTERAAAGKYESALRHLTAGGSVYQCFCTPKELAAEREAALARGDMPKYSGRCRHIGPADRDALAASGRLPTWRFAVPPDRKIIFEDIIKGRLEFSTEVIGDFIISRENGVPTYNFAAAVDDGEMKITHVVRGEDHLTNTARQLLIFEALGLAPPAFAHLSMILGPDRAKLSKRHGAASVGEYRKAGYLPGALINNLALLSWSSASGEEILDIETLQGEFSLNRVSKSPPVFDGAKLKWFNAQHIKRLPAGDLAALVRPYLPDEWTAALESAGGEERLARIVEAVRTNLEVPADITVHAKIFFDGRYDKETGARLTSAEGTEIRSVAAAALRIDRDITIDEAKELVDKIKHDLRELGHKPKDIFQTLRLSLTGELSGPELFLLFYALGPAESVRRLEAPGRN